MNRIIIGLFVFLTACASPITPPAPELVSVQHTLATQAWLPELYSCASDAGVGISLETRAPDYFDPSSQLSIRLGEPELASSLAYEIGMDEIVVVTHPENPIQSLALSDLRALFSGEILNWGDLGGESIPVQTWVFGSGEDIRLIFDAAVMLHQPISSQARLAVSIDSMLAGVGADRGAVGFLPRSLATASVRIENIEDLPSPLVTPVLILASPDADQIAMTLVSCMQNK